MNEVKSSFGRVVWPAIPTGSAATMLAIQFQLERSQWLKVPELEQLQLRQADIMLRHAASTVPYYQQLLGSDFPGDTPLTMAGLRQIPLLTRSALQLQGDSLISRAIPSAHGQISEIESSGSTGTPVKGKGTEITRLFWRSFSLRESLWHSRDFSCSLMAIRPEMDLPPGEVHFSPEWGAEIGRIFSTGPAAVINSRTPVRQQVEHLLKVKPDCLLSLPSNIAGIVSCLKEMGEPPPPLKYLRTYGETVDDGLRRECLDYFGVAPVDMYSAQEVGYMAIQCPLHDNYHVMSEGVIMEVIDDDGKQCLPGETGRVVVTTLHNFAMPLIRYEIGDYAEVGEPCPCGRGLPSIRRFLGRVRNMLTMPDGSRSFPSFPAKKWSHIAPVRQMQLVQKSGLHIEARVVTDVEFSANQTESLAAALKQTLGADFAISIVFVAAIERSRGGKFEDFINETAILQDAPEP